MSNGKLYMYTTPPLIYIFVLCEGFYRLNINIPSTPPVIISLPISSIYSILGYKSII